MFIRGTVRKRFLIIGCLQGGQCVSSDKCEFHDKSSMASNLSQTHSAAPTHWNFTEVLKVPFFISQRPSGACLFNVVCDAAWGLREPIASCGTIRETFFFCFFHFWFFVDWKEILKHCAMVPQKFWKVVRGFGQQSVWEPVGWRKGLHVASFQNGVLPDSTCEYPLPFSKLS